MNKDQNFDPYIDWDGLTDEMAKDLRERIKPYRKATDRFLRWGRRKDAITILRLQAELGALSEAIIQSLVTLPMMVHVAGGREVEPHEDHTHTVQRCKRCGSTLQFWKEGLAEITPGGIIPMDEEDMNWWDEGDVVAKSGVDQGGVSMYVIENGRELEPHEKLCPDLAQLS